MYTAERNFVTTATRQMLNLERMWTAPTGIATSKTHTLSDHALCEIKKAAFSVEARGVFRAASLCEDILNRLGSESTTKLHNSLSALKHLISQYTDGLIEIDPAFQVPQENPVQSKTVISAPVDVQSSDQQAHEKAASVLSPLVRFVKDDKRAKALTALMRPAPFHSLPQVDDNARATFDGLMRPVTNLILSEARHSGKNISVSYAADFQTVEQETAAGLQNFLEIICLNIVSNGVSKTAEGEHRGTQISLNAQIRSERYELTVSWRGNPLPEAALAMPHSAAALDQLKIIGGSWQFKSSVLPATGGSHQTMGISYPIRPDFKSELRSKTVSAPDTPFESKAF